MLYALAHPASLAFLLGSYVLGITLHGWVQCLVADRFGDRRPRLERRTRPEPQVHLDPFGAVGALVSGIGWTKPVELLDRRRRGAVLAAALSGPVLNIAIGVGLLLAFRFAVTPGPNAGALAVDFHLNGAGFALQRGFDGTVELLPRALLLVGASQLYLGVLSLVPLPPLDGGRLLFALAPRTLGWQKAEYQLVERNIGIVAVLVLLMVPLGGPLPLLPQLLDTLLRPLLGLLTGI